ncbi:hypothetical protein SISSUDRAFT_1038288 [Sistotremastrum suecicum HHB10207 ss-3]|uniref:SWIM-type domain-containing protein n=1 Tax=Sistotremastrum suecicum HHB10207 ss-3 TaxID=1314776 RepID=A0A165WYN7_9AGAM|nr:hypothetical protein SISSUDRAFT_1038288 [Sistotremastrum suecicum HHB10207 ss-3]
MSRPMLTEVLVAFREAQRCRDTPDDPWADAETSFNEKLDEICDKYDELAMLTVLREYFQENWWCDEWRDNVIDAGLPHGLTRDVFGINTDNWTEAGFKMLETLFLKSRKNKRVDRLIAIYANDFLPYFRHWSRTEPRFTEEYWEVTEKGHDIWAANNVDPCHGTTQYDVRFQNCHRWQQTGKYCEHLWAIHWYESNGSIEEWNDFSYSMRRKTPQPLSADVAPEWPESVVTEADPAVSEILKELERRLPSVLQTHHHLPAQSRNGPKKVNWADTRVEGDWGPRGPRRDDLPEQETWSSDSSDTSRAATEVDVEVEDSDPFSDERDIAPDSDSDGPDTASSGPQSNIEPEGTHSNSFIPQDGKANAVPVVEYTEYSIHQKLLSVEADPQSSLHCIQAELSVNQAKPARPFCPVTPLDDGRNRFRFPGCLDSASHKARKRQGTLQQQH